MRVTHAHNAKESDKLKEDRSRQTAEKKEWRKANEQLEKAKASTKLMQRP